MTSATPFADPPVRWGILGAGRIARAVGSDIAATAGNVVTAVGARDAARARTLADELGAPHAYGSYAELVADPEIDVVYIATTHGQHHEHALLTLSAGKPILMEKAFTLNARQAGEVIALARARRLFCMEAMWMRFNPLIRAAEQAVADGAIGQVRSVVADLSAQFTYDPAHRLFDLAVGGGALLDLGVYPTTFAYLFLGQPHGVVATGAITATGADSTVAMQWSYPDGRFAQVACASLSPSPSTGRVSGTSGYLTLGPRMHTPAELTIVSGERSRTIRHEAEGYGYRPQIAEVARCLRAGLTESPVATLDDTLAIMTIMDDARAQVGVHYPADEEAEQ